MTDLQIVGTVVILAYGAVMTVMFYVACTEISSLKDGIKRAKGRPIELLDLRPADYKVNESDSYALVWEKNLVPGTSGTESPIAVRYHTTIPAQFAIRAPSDQTRVFDTAVADCQPKQIHPAIPFGVEEPKDIPSSTI